jgi:hypothetical protein
MTYRSDIDSMRGYDYPKPTTDQGQTGPNQPPMSPPLSRENVQRIRDRVEEIAKDPVRKK